MMITAKLILSVLAMACGVISATLGAKSYMISLRNELRLKYNRIAGSDEYTRQELMQKEYERRVGRTIMVMVIAFLLVAYAAYVTVLCLKNNVSLI